MWFFRKRAKYLKIWAKMYKIWKYFEKGQLIVCNKRMQYTARIGPGTIRFIKLSNNLMNFFYSDHHQQYFFWLPLDLLLIRWSDNQAFSLRFPFPFSCTCGKSSLVCLVWALLSIPGHHQPKAVVSMLPFIIVHWRTHVK